MRQRTAHMTNVVELLTEERRRIAANAEVLLRGRIPDDLHASLIRSIETGVDLAESMKLPLAERPLGWHWPDAEQNPS